jgi:FkbM family methyltransferase
MFRRSVVVELAGVKVRMGRHIAPEVQQHFHTGAYEWPERRALQLRLRPDDVVMELGTGIGLLSAYCAKAIGSERVFTYEANPRLERHIRDTYALNGVSPTLDMCMLAEKEGSQTFYVREAFWESSTVPDGRPAQAITVPAKSFNDEAARINPSFLIMDIEGGEYELCRHMRFFDIKQLLIEVHKGKLGDKRARQVRSRLYRAGFRVDRKLTMWEVLFLERP